MSTSGKKDRSDADGGWKDAIADFTEEFFAFFFPDVHAATDFSKGVQFLDAELRQITPKSDRRRRHADRLAKVMLKTGEERWLHIHIEVQGRTSESPEQFAKRMYVYHYRICDAHEKDVISLAVLTDDDPEFRPREYRQGLLGTTVSFTFPTVKLIDMDPEALAASSNVFALVTRIQLDHNRVRRNPGRRYERKLALTRELYRRGADRDRVIRLFRFLDFVMRLPLELEIQYRRELEVIEGELEMPYITSIERMAKEEGLVEGRVEGLVEGRVEGQLQGLRESILDALEARFEDVPYEIREAIDHVDDDAELKRLHRLAIGVAGLDDFKV